QSVFFSLSWSFRPDSVSKNLLFQSCVFRYQTPFGNSRSVWDCKGRNLFIIVKLFLKLFFFLFFMLFKATTAEADPKTKETFPISTTFQKPAFRLSLFLRSGVQK
ncbi:hypothetical protein, partial [Pedobacter frigoris]|uniref:hypothetical protein n=1 Tax=Pedobacter frigoris TaxID=2571272 RepID=UPI00197D3DE6